MTKYIKLSESSAPYIGRCSFAIRNYKIAQLFLTYTQAMITSHKTVMNDTSSTKVVQRTKVYGTTDYKYT